jgi:hypothetical protein
MLAYFPPHSSNTGVIHAAACNFPNSLPIRASHKGQSDDAVEAKNKDATAATAAVAARSYRLKFHILRRGM